MTSTPVPTGSTKTALELVVGDLVVVSNRLAAYHSKPELAGQALPVVSIVRYPGTTIGITLEGLPETCAAASAPIIVR